MQEVPQPNQGWTVQRLEEFSEEIAEIYKTGSIHGPIHLGGGEGHASNLINIFKNVKQSDWIFGTWRSHYLWLLSGRSPDELRRQILDGHSMHVFGDRFFTSAIVGGIAPIAVGVAYAIKEKKGKEKVWCFLGDMGASTGIAIESMRYACGHNLPINFIIEDNGLSVRTDTLESWGCKGCDKSECNLIGKKYNRYVYHRKYPHAGTGVFVLF